MADRFGDYQLVKYFTAGGMADLYLASHPTFRGELVLKKIQPRYLELTRVVKMFLDEGRIAQALRHPNIVTIVDVGQADGTYYIAMEYIPGRDLTAICRRGIEVGHFLPRHLAVAILLQALRGLAHAHEKVDDHGRPLKVVHCDISPGNIVVSWRGTVKIVDFGIARAAIQLRAEDHTVAGKYNYMAPEQIRGESIDARADLFALGVILYELTVGKRLFRGRPEQVMRLVLDEPIVPPSALRPDFPPRLEAIVLRALERDPARRFPSARALKDELAAWLDEEGRPPHKRELAVYLREIFAAEKSHEADEFVGTDDDDDELHLDPGLPRSASGLHELPLEVDPEEDETPPPLAIPVVSAPRAEAPPPAATRPAEPTPTAPLPKERTPTAPLPTERRPAPAPQPSRADEVTRPTLRPPARRGLDGALVVAAAAIAIVGLALYFILRG